MALTKIGKEGITGISNSSDANAITIDSSERVGIGTSSPVSDAKLTISSDNTESNIFLERSGSGKFDVAIANTSGALSFKGGSNQTTVAGLTEFMKIDGDTGAVTKPLQPAFLATVGTTQSNPSSSSRVAFNSEVFDQNADYDPSIYVFTAPVTGKYFLSISIRLDQPDTAADFIRFNIVTSNRGYNSSIFDLGNLSGDPNYWNMQTAVLADMDAGDTAEVEIIYAGGAAQADISTESFFSGCLVC